MGDMKDGEMGCWGFWTSSMSLGHGDGVGV